MTKDTKILGLPENACVLPWKHVAITTNGDMRPCCRFNEVAFKRSEDNHLRLPNIQDGLKDGFSQGEFFNKVRQRMLNNERLDICKKCWISEEVTKDSDSMRTHWNAEYADKIINNEATPSEIQKIDLEYLEIAFSSHCNLACRMCGPELSSKWAAIEKHYGINQEADLTKYQLDVDKFDMDLSKLTKIKLVGGEPLLAKEHDQFIEKLLENHKNLSNLEITYHTNGTLRPSKKVLDFWKKIKRVVLILSIDGFGERNNYLRPGQIKWDTIEKNVQYFVSLANNPEYNLDVSTHSVVSRLNVLQLHKLNDWILSQGMPVRKNSIHSLDILSWPPEMSLFGLSDLDKKVVYSYVENFVKTSPKVVFSDSIQRLFGVLKKKTPENEIITLEDLSKRMEMLDEYFNVSFSDLEDVI